ncbi:MAG TPA: ribose 5-phosphate isomerase B [Anaerolineales bacterium]|nr:ribose 5-phosphate isomerase B [Anaerolineales bacterium]
MMIDDDQIQQIVQRVLSQVTGSAPNAGQMTSSPAAASLEATKPESNASGNRVVAIGADHGGFDLKEDLRAYVTQLGFDVRDMGAYNKSPVDYPEFAHAVAKLVSTGKAWRGIMIDGAGIGSCIVANKVPGVRAGMAYDISTANNGREHNDTNLLTLGAGLIGVNLARQIVKTWLETQFGGGRHAPRVEKITAVEKLYLK